MTVKTRPEARARVGDIAIVAVTMPLGLPFYRIDEIELDTEGRVVAYVLHSLHLETRHLAGDRIPADRVTAVIPNVLVNPSEK